MQTLFSHLATRFSASPENIAIDALGYVLQRSAAARKTAIATLWDGTSDQPRDLAFTTQSGAEDGARPDLEAFDEHHTARLVIECKFWAGLTVNQPVTYLSRLPHDGTGVLAFIVPAARFSYLWAELCGRLNEAGHVVGERQQRAAGHWSASLAGGRRFVLISWHALLQPLLASLDKEEDQQLAEDTRQLIGLCDRMDDDAFLPLRSEELTGTANATRYVQFCKLADEIGKSLVAAGVCEGKNFTSAGGLGYFGRFIGYRGTSLFICFAAEAWAKFHVSPIWLRLEPRNAPSITERLMVERARTQSDFFEDAPYLWVPVLLKPEAEHDEVLRSAVAQIEQILPAIIDEKSGKSL